MDTPIQSEAVAPEAQLTYESLAQVLELPALEATLSDNDLSEVFRTAAEAQVAAVVVRPSDVDYAVRALGSSGTRVASVTGWPDGSSVTGTKLFELRDLLRRGAKEIEFVVNVGKLMSRQFQHVETELLQAAKSCREEGAVLRVNPRTDLLPDDLKIIITKICRRVEADVISVDPSEATLQVITPLLKEQIRLKVWTGEIGLEEVIRMHATGIVRVSTRKAIALLEQWRARLAEMAAAASSEGKASS